MSEYPQKHQAFNGRVAIYGDEYEDVHSLEQWIENLMRRVSRDPFTAYQYDVLACHAYAGRALPPQDFETQMLVENSQTNRARHLQKLARHADVNEAYRRRKAESEGRVYKPRKKRRR